MKLKVRRTKTGRQGYELYDADANNQVLKSGLTAGQVYQHMVTSQLQAVMAAVDNLLHTADEKFEKTLVPQEDDTTLELADPGAEQFDDIQLLDENDPTIS
jgi:hypothetical protein